MEMIQEELREKEMQLTGLSANFEHESSLANQRIESLEQTLKDTKETLNRMHEIGQENLDGQKQSFVKERNELIEKYELV